MKTSPYQVKSRCTWPVWPVCFSVVVNVDNVSTPRTPSSRFSPALSSRYHALVWGNHVSNTSVLQVTGSYDLITIIRHRHLRETSTSARKHATALFSTPPLRPVRIPGVLGTRTMRCPQRSVSHLSTPGPPT